jgi:FKBP-type peptidyl-prolyl cis-trans isomerase
LYYTITQEGTGPQITSGQKVSMRYTGKLLDGKVFDSNMGNDKPVFTFPVGQHQVIAGWDEGVALLKKGTKATFYIISSLGYGARGAGAAIGPNAVLLFDVEVVDIVSEK